MPAKVYDSTLTEVWRNSKENRIFYTNLKNSLLLWDTLQNVFEIETYDGEPLWHSSVEQIFPAANRDHIVYIPAGSNLRGLVRWDGKEILPPEYLRILPSRNLTHYETINSNYERALYDLDGNIVVPPGPYTIQMIGVGSQDKRSVVVYLTSAGRHRVIDANGNDYLLKPVDKVMFFLSRQTFSRLATMASITSIAQRPENAFPKNDSYRSSPLSSRNLHGNIPSNIQSVNTISAI